MSNDENREKNEEKAAVPVQPIIDMGSTVVKNSRGTVHCLTIVGQVEGHTLLPDNLKSTKYEHVLPLLSSVEEKDDVDGLLLLLNTVGGDVETGLALAELIASGVTTIADMYMHTPAIAETVLQAGISANLSCGGV